MLIGPDRREEYARGSLRSTFGRRLRALRLAQEMSQVELARRIGRHQTAIGPYERDEYEPPRDVVEKLAARARDQPGIPLLRPQPAAGHAAGGSAGSAPPGCSSRSAEGPLELLSLRDEQLRGYRVQDDSMAPVFRPGQIALVLAAPARSRRQLLGRDALVELADGRVLLRRLMPSADARSATTLPPTTRRPYRRWRSARPDPSSVCFGRRRGASAVEPDPAK